MIILKTKALSKLTESIFYMIIFNIVFILMSLKNVFVYRCKYRTCPYKFVSNEKLQQHMVCHVESDSTNYFKCSVCKDVKFAKWRPCSLHLWKKHQIGMTNFNGKKENMYA